MNTVEQLVESPFAALGFLVAGGFLEAFGDSFFQAAFYHSQGWGRLAALIAGAVVLTAYRSIVNLPRWDFGRLIGVYVAVFFLMAQILARVRFGQSPTIPIYTGGSLIVAGGLVMAFWRV